MKLTRSHKIALGIALIFIALGLFQAVTGMQINKKVMDQLSFVLLLGAAYVLFSGRRKKPSTEDTDTKQEEVAVQDTIDEQDGEKKP